MGIGGTCFWLAAHARIAQLRRRARDPRTSQLRTLRTLVTRAMNTAFGRHHDFALIHDHRIFRMRVPIRRHAALAPWFAQARAGERDVSWPGRIPYVARTRGTTADAKSFPLSMESIAQKQRGAFDAVAAYVAGSGDRSLTDGKWLFLGGSNALETLPNGIRTGDTTGIMANHIPWLAQGIQLPRPRGITDGEERLARIARECLDEDVRLVAGCPSEWPALFELLLEEARARKRKPRSLRSIWPNLRVLIGGGASYAPYREELDALAGGPIPYVETYVATEGGILGVRDRLDDAAMLLLPDNGVFYELVPFEELQSLQPTRLPLWEAERDVVYALVVSTMSGIFACSMGDCIRFVETFPHRFVFERRVTRARVTASAARETTRGRRARRST